MITEKEFIYKLTLIYESNGGKKNEKKVDKYRYPRFYLGCLF
jgi:hypothetical protein